jgi:hypothetical protein
MQKSKPLTDIEGEVHELTAADMKRFQRTKQCCKTWPSACAALGHKLICLRG